MVNYGAMIVELHETLEKAGELMKTLKDAKVDDALDGRALAVALTQLETAQLWFARARKQL